ncbi:MAG: flagellar hook-basal body complex protein FliE [Pseudomonadota bacterium]
MNTISPDQLLAQIREMQSQLEPKAIEQPENAPDFGKLLTQSVSAVAELQSEAGAAASAYERGDEGADLTQVMISMQKASLSFQAMTEVRNKLVTAYQEIMNMPV